MLHSKTAASSSASSASYTFSLRPSFRSAHKSANTGGRREKKKIYHRDPDLDRAIDLRKKPTLLLRLRDIILASRSRSILLRDLEKEVGFVQKWAFLSLIEKQPAIFRVSGGSDGSPFSVRLTDAAERVSELEPLAREEMEPVLVRNLRKLLMLSVDCQVPLEKVELIAPDLGLPEDFEDSVIAKHHELFTVRNLSGRDYLCLESWDSSLAVTAREEKLDLGEKREERKSSDQVPRDGNFQGPFAFKICYPPGFRPNTHYLKEVMKWQKMPFPSPYLNARSVETGTPQARKRAVAVLHEILSFTVEKWLTSDKLDAFHNEYQLPFRLLLCLVKNHGIFYITNKGAKSTVILKEAYRGCYLTERCPLIRFCDRFAALSGRTCPDARNVMAL